MIEETTASPELARIDQILSGYFTGATREERRTVNVDLRVFNALKIYARRRGWTLQMTVQHLVKLGLDAEYHQQIVASLKAQVVPEERAKIEQLISDCSPGTYRDDRRSINVEHKLHTALKMWAQRRDLTLQSVVHYLIIEGIGYELLKMAITTQNSKETIAVL